MPEFDREPPPKTRTKLHKQLFDLLVKLGIETCDEQAVGIYSIDLFCEEAWVGFEADGKLHKALGRKQKDKFRDWWIDDRAAIPLLRLTQTDLSTKKSRAETANRILDFVNRWSLTAEERRCKGQWIF